MDLTSVTKLDNREQENSFFFAVRTLARVLPVLSIISGASREPRTQGESFSSQSQRRDARSTLLLQNGRVHDQDQAVCVSIVIIFDYVNNRFFFARRVLRLLSDQVRRSRCKQLLLLRRSSSSSPADTLRGVFRVDHSVRSLTQRHGTQLVCAEWMREMMGRDVDDDDDARDSFGRIRGRGENKTRKQVFLWTSSVASLRYYVDLSKSEPGPASRTNLIYTNRSFDMLIVSRLATT